MAGYAMECSISMKDTGIRLAKAGYAVHGIDYEGHGKSSGLQGYVPSFDDVVNDCSDYFTNICEKKENKKKLRYLLGESMGGAVALLIHQRQPKFWDGAVLVAPMCKIADEMRPHPFVISSLKQLANLIPTWKLIPTPDIIEVAFRQPRVREQIRSNPYCYKGRPRLRTGAELLDVSLNLEKNLTEVSLPFIVLHGGDDKVTDPSVSKLLYDTALSTDKTYKLYPGMWHALVTGELPENMGIVFSDIISWLDERINGGDDPLRSEGARKARHDAQHSNSYQNK
ncbi:hypothetical protein ACLOJK_028090 [Asimina triloba]